MTKLGTKKRPAVFRVQSMERAEEIMSICYENQWEFIVGIEPDKLEDIRDIEKLLNPPQPILVDSFKAGRNDPCICGSGKKYKKCCWI